MGFTYTGMEPFRHREEVFLGFNAIGKYLEYIGVQVLDTKIEQFEGIDPKTLDRYHAFCMRYTCELPKELFHFFEKIATLTSIEKYPKINQEELLATDSPLRAFSIFEYDEVARFDLDVRAVRCKEDIDEYVRELKRHTEGLIYKKFSDHFDEELEDEIGD